MSYSIEKLRVPTVEDWDGTRFQVNVCDAEYLREGSVIEARGLPGGEPVLEIRIIGPSGVVHGPMRADLAPNGLLTFHTVTQQTIVTRSGQEVPAGTQFWNVYSMIIFTKDSASDPGETIIDKHITGLALIEDPEDVGVMGADETGGGDEPVVSVG